MTDQNILQMITDLEQEIDAAEGPSRVKLQEQVHQTIEALEQDGQPVPQRLRDLDGRLIDESVESFFDNMPV